MKILILFIFSAKALPFIQRGVFRKSCGREPDEVYSMWDICEVCDDRASCLNIGRASLVFILRDVTRFTPLLALLVQ